MTGDPFVQFINFVEHERALRQNYLNQQLLKKEIDQLQSIQQQEEDRVAALRQHVQALLNRIQAYESEARKQSDREHEVQKRLLEVVNAREYTALYHELEELARKNELLEKNWVQTSQEHEVAKAEYDEQEKNSEAFLAGHKQLTELKRQELKSNEEHAITLEKERDELERTVNPEFLMEYAAMKESVDDPVVAAEGVFCSVCHHQITHHDLSLLRRHILVSCKECYRKLYLPL